MARRKRKKTVSNTLGMLTIGAVVLLLLVVLSVKTSELKAKEASYALEEESLAAEYEEELARAEELAQQRIYIQTTQYIEELAKSRLGLVYPDEIILKPES